MTSGFDPLSLGSIPSTSLSKYVKKSNEYFYETTEATMDQAKGLGIYAKEPIFSFDDVEKLVKSIAGSAIENAVQHHDEIVEKGDGGEAFTQLFIEEYCGFVTELATKKVRKHRKAKDKANKELHKRMQERFG